MNFLIFDCPRLMRTRNEGSRLETRAPLGNYGPTGNQKLHSPLCCPVCHMDPEAWTRIGSKVLPLLSKSPDVPFRVVRSASALVIKPQTYERGVSLLTHLLKYKDITHKAKQLVYAAIETSGCAFCVNSSLQGAK